MASKPDRVKAAIQEAIKASSELKAGNYISVSAKRDGPPIVGKHRIELTGRASSDKDKAKIEEIARSRSEGLEVVSYIRTGRAG